VGVNIRAELRSHRTIRCGDMAIYPFLNMAAVRHLGFLKVVNVNFRYSFKLGANRTIYCGDIVFVSSNLHTGVRPARNTAVNYA